MSEEDGFLAALDESPDDGVTRLAYADWLEERGDPRAELLRLEEARRVGDPTTARHWALQATLAPEWVVRVARAAPLAELRVLVPPPRRPNRPDGSWAAVEAAMGLRLPEDYKAFLDVYGVGTLSHIDIHHPFIDGGDVRYDWARFAGAYDDEREYRGMHYLSFPEPGGLLPFGTLGDVDTLGWLTEGEAHEWPFVYLDRETGFHRLRGLSAVEFMLEAVSNCSPLLRRMGAIAFEAPVVFRPTWFGGGNRYLVHPEAVDMRALTAQVAARWAAEEVHIEHSDHGGSVYADPLQGAVSLMRDGDPRTWLTIRHGPEGAALAAEIESEMRAAGFRDLG